ncbi:ester hydrolase C11orf54-like [Oscarella lobularis]|uniref:ester hydrolase C11orf54-like n=1 Tax=Oscarella lobularis TaxID=121494 RepID=UPI0033132B9C
MEAKSGQSTFPDQKAPLYNPPLAEIETVLRKGLEKNFGLVSVSVAECPDLRETPWNLAAPGLCGNARLADVGGVPNLVPLVDLENIQYFDFDDVAKRCDLPGAFILGAGAGSSRFVGVNCELMPNLRTAKEDDPGRIRSFSAKVSEEDGSCILERYNSREFSLLANLFLSEGNPGKVLKVEASNRTGDQNFVTCMRLALAEHYGPTKPVALGGAFLIDKGKAKLHVMPAFSKVPLQTDKDVADWLRFYEMKSQLVCLSVFISHDPDLDLRLEHTHCFSDHGEGGHYHWDTTPEEVKYIGYFVPAQDVYRLGRPKSTHNVGRD